MNIYMYCMAPIGFVITVLMAAYMRTTDRDGWDYGPPPWLAVLFFGTLLSAVSGIILPIAAIAGLIYALTVGVSNLMKTCLKSEDDNV